MSAIVVSAIVLPAVQACKPMTSVVLVVLMCPVDLRFGAKSKSQCVPMAESRIDSQANVVLH